MKQAKMTLGNSKNIRKVADLLSSRRPEVLLVCIIFLGLALRFAFITFRELWYDEASTAVLIQLNWKEMFELLITDVHPLLYYSVLKIWGMLFGFGEIPLRMFSLIFGVALIPTVYTLMKQGTKNKSTALLAALLISINPFLIAYSVENRMYSLLALNGIVATIFFFRLVENHSQSFLKNLAFFSLFISLACYTHYIGMFLFPALGLYLVYRTFSGVGRDLRSILSKIRDLLISSLKLFVPSILLIAPQTTLLINQFVTEPGIGWIPKVNIATVPMSLYAFLFGVETSGLGQPPLNDIVIPIVSQIIVIIAILLLLFVGTLLLWRRFKGGDRHFMIYILTLFVTPIIITVLLSLVLDIRLYINRYLVLAGVFLVLYLTLLLSKIQPRETGTFILLLYFALLLGVRSDSHNKEIRRLPNYLETQNLYTEGQLQTDITLTDPYDFVTARYYLGLQNDDRIHIRDFGAPGYDFSHWPAIGGKFVYYERSEVPLGSYIVTRDPKAEEVEEWEEVGRVEPLVIYQKTKQTDESENAEDTEIETPS